MSRKQLLFWFVIVADLIGAVYGFIFYYGQRLLATDPILWIFVADCPFYTLLIAIVLLLVYFRKKISWLYFLAFVGALKYGFWTVFVLTLYFPFYFTPENSLIYAILYVAHIGLILETILLFGKIELKKRFLVIALFWFLLNDAVDYPLLSTHPSLPLHSLGFMFLATMAMSVGFTLIAYYLIKRIKKSPIELFE